MHIRVACFVVACHMSIQKSTLPHARHRFESNSLILDRCSRLGCTSMLVLERWEQPKKQCQLFLKLQSKISITNSLHFCPQTNQMSSWLEPFALDQKPMAT